MRIVLPVHHFPPRYNAGAELYTFRLARWLLGHGHEAEVVCVERTDLDSAEGLAAVKDAYQGVPVWRLALALRGAPASWGYENPLIGRWMADYLARFAPDLLHLQSGYLLGVAPLVAARALGIPAIATLHDFWFLCPRITLQRGDGSLCPEPPTDPVGCAWCMKLESRRFRLPDQATGGLLGAGARRVGLGAERRALAARRERLAEALAGLAAAIAPSHFLAARYAGLVPAERLHVLRYGLDTAHLRQALPSDDQGALRIGYIGQIAAHKGVHVLARAVKSLAPVGRPVELTIYGNPEQDHSYTDRLKALIADDPRIRLAGRFDNSRIAEVLGQFDLTVVPSIWYENSPLAIMEAQAAGRPVLTSALGGMAELVRDEVDGLHFRPGDSTDLARQIQRFRDDRSLLARLRAGLRPLATIDDEMSTLLSIYRRAAARNSVGV